jgi:hypothetical protein
MKKKIIVIMIIGMLLSSAMILFMVTPENIGTKARSSVIVWGDYYNNHTANPGAIISGTHIYIINATYTRTIIRNITIPGFPSASWVSAINSTVGNNIINFPMVYANLFSVAATTDIVRTYLYFNLSCLPIFRISDITTTNQMKHPRLASVGVKSAYMHISFNDGEPGTDLKLLVEFNNMLNDDVTSGSFNLENSFESRTQNTYPHGNLELGDFSWMHYKTPAVAAGTYTETGIVPDQPTNFTFGNAGLDFLTNYTSMQDSDLSLGFMMITELDQLGNDNMSYYRILNPITTGGMYEIGNQQNVHLTIEYVGGMGRGENYYPPLTRDIELLYMVKSLLWFIGLGGMIVTPMMVVKTTREGEGGLAGRFNGSVFWVGLFIVFLAFFFWAIS